MKLSFLYSAFHELEHDSSHFKIGLILCLGAILRLIALGRQSLWLDEAFSYWAANRSWQALLASLPYNDTHPPLYYLSLQPMIALGGQEWLLRLPSAIAGTVSIGLIFALGKELFDQKTALLAAFMIVISPFHLWFAQEARMYALITALTLAAGLFAIRALRTNHYPDWLLFGLFEGTALLTDVSAVWFVLSFNAAWLLLLKTHWRSGRFWQWLAAQLLAFLIYLPWFPKFLRQLSNGITGWIPAATLTILARTVTDFIGSYERRSTLGSLFALVVLVTPFVVTGRQLFRDVSNRKMQYTVLGCWLLVPIGLSFLVSQPYFQVAIFGISLGQGRSIFLTRNLIVASIPLLLLFARSIVWSPRPVVIVALAGFVAMSSVSYHQNVLSASKEDFRTAAQIVREEADRQDLILFTPPYLKMPFAYYWNRSPFTEVGLDILTNGVIRGSALQADIRSVEKSSGNYQRVWLIMNSDNIYRKDVSKLKQVLDSQGCLLKSREAYGVSIFLYRIPNNMEILDPSRF